MKTIESEDLLWEMGCRVQEQRTTLPTITELEAYRGSRLAPEETERLETLLADSVRARSELMTVAGAEAPVPAPHLRESVLASFDRQRSSRRELRLWGGLVAAGAAAALGALLLAGSPEPLPAEIDFEVQIEGLAMTRGTVSKSQEIDAYPETNIVITASPKSNATSGIHFALYRDDDRHLQRIPTGGSISLAVERGSVTLRARALDLMPEGVSARLASAAGAIPTRFFLVAARPGDLPSRLELDGTNARPALEAGGSRRAYPLVIHLSNPPRLE